MPIDYSVSRPSRARDFLVWAERMWGAFTITPRERAVRFAEEAVELAQAAGVPEELMTVLVKRTYARPKGDAYKEFCQASLLLEAYGEVAFAVAPNYAAAQEWARVQTIPEAEWKRRHEAKAGQGILQKDDK